MGWVLFLTALYLAAVWCAHRAGVARGRHEGYLLGRKDEQNGVPLWTVMTLPPREGPHA